MAKKKFNKEERQAIIKKLTKIANERTKASWEKHRAVYKPSEKYQRVKMLIDQRNKICEELREVSKTLFSWSKFDTVIDSQHYLNEIRDNEIRHLVERYEVNETDLEVEIILMDQDKSVEDLIERLLRNCLCK